MGGGSWTSDDYVSYAKSTNYRSATREEVFSNRSMPKAFDPARITLRESCDSADNPKSTPIIFGLDVTGSMGEYAERIAKDELPKLMTAILEHSPVSNPHMMFMGIDDIYDGYNAPLQVSQFEADIRILEQLRQLWLVGQGGGNQTESYDYAWYFAARKTVTDSWEKRKEKGFLFTIGDEPAPRDKLRADELRQTFGKGEYSDMTPAQALAEAKEKYHVFHIVIEQGNFYSSRPRQVRDSWTELMGPNVLFLSDFKDLTELVIATMKIVKGADMDKVLTESKRASAMRHAFINALSEGG